MEIKNENERDWIYKMVDGKKVYRVVTDEEILEFLTTHYRPDGECHIWGGPFKHKSGTPEVYFNGNRYSARKLLLQLTGRRTNNGSIPYASCGNKRCINLEHMRYGKQSDIVAAAVKRGCYRNKNRRVNAMVSAAKNAKLPFTERASVARMRGDGMTWRQIGDRFGVSESGASNAWRRWSALGDSIFLS